MRATVADEEGPKSPEGVEVGGADNGQEGSGEERGEGASPEAAVAEAAAAEAAAAAEGSEGGAEAAEHATFPHTPGEVNVGARHADVVLEEERTAEEIEDAKLRLAEANGKVVLLTDDGDSDDAAGNGHGQIEEAEADVPAALSN